MELAGGLGRDISGGRLAMRWLPLEANGDAARRPAKAPQYIFPDLSDRSVGTSAFVALDFLKGAAVSGARNPSTTKLLLELIALSPTLATVRSGRRHGR